MLVCSKQSWTSTSEQGIRNYICFQESSNYETEKESTQQSWQLHLLVLTLLSRHLLWTLLEEYQMQTFSLNIWMNPEGLFYILKSNLLIHLFPTALQYY